MTPARRFGCEDCGSDDAERAWLATRARALAVLEQQSHFSVRLVACTCGQAFAQVFTERVDWQGGEDPQDWVLVPLEDGEPASLALGASTAAIEALSRGRRCLWRSFPSDGPLRAVWQDGPVTIGPHD